MFKLIKINNSPSNVPEIETLTKLISLKTKTGEAIKTMDGRGQHCSSDELPTHITCCEAVGGETTLKAYRITKDMVFEVEYTGSTALYVGARVPMDNKGTGCMCSVGEPDGAGPFLVVGSNGNNAIVVLY